MRSVLLVFVLLCSFIDSFSQPEIEWQRCLGGSSDERSNYVQQTSDGGYIVAGWTKSNFLGFHGEYDIWIVKLTYVGNVQWAKCIGGEESEGFASWESGFSGLMPTTLQEASDGFLIAGSTFSNDGDVAGNHSWNELNPGMDGWLVKLDFYGEILWQRCIGGSGRDGLNEIRSTSDGGFIIAGTSTSNDGDVSGNHSYNSDAWVIKIDNEGSIQWQKCLGGTDDESAQTIRQLNDGGYILSGLTNSIDGDVISLHDQTYYTGQNSADIWVVRLDTEGNILWQKSLGGSLYENVSSIEQCYEGGFIVCGRVHSIDGDVIGNQNFNTNFSNGWVIKLDGNGMIEWQKCLGGNKFESFSGIKQTIDGGYVVAGFTDSWDGDVADNHSDFRDVWLVKLNSNGNIIWEHCYGGAVNEDASSLNYTQDGGLVISGWTDSYDSGDVSGHHQQEDYWVVKLSSITGVYEESVDRIEISPNPAIDNLELKVGVQFVGCSISIYDVFGKLAHSDVINSTNSTISVQHLSAGLYTLVSSSYHTPIQFIKK